jgi:hypothetical protein
MQDFFRECRPPTLNIWGESHAIFPFRARGPGRLSGSPLTTPLISSSVTHPGIKGALKNIAEDEAS